MTPDAARPLRRDASRSSWRARHRYLSRRAWWPWLRRGAWLAFFALLAWLIAHEARTLDWDDVGQTLRGYPLATLAGAFGLAAASHLLYSCFDLFGRRYSGHALPTPAVMAVTFISYAFNLNLGSWIGAIGLRLRLYTRMGLEPSVVAQVVSISMLTNWIGYLLLAGALFVLHPLDLPPDWKLDSGGLRWVGAAMLGTVAAYVLVCARWHDRSWTVRGHVLRPPRVGFALMQISLSAANWAVIGAVVWVLLQPRLSYPGVLGALLVAAIAGVIAHVPGGLGVLEAVFVALLSPWVPAPKLLAALLAYRAVYYLVPLVLAALAYVAVEARLRRGTQNTGHAVDRARGP